jgi:hypothetical protein
MSERQYEHQIEVCSFITGSEIDLYNFKAGKISVVFKKISSLDGVPAATSKKQK